MSFIGGTQVSRMGKESSWRERDGVKHAVTKRSFVGRKEQSRLAKERNARIAPGKAAVIAAVTSVN